MKGTNFLIICSAEFNAIVQAGLRGRVLSPLTSDWGEAEVTCVGQMQDGTFKVWLNPRQHKEQKK